MSQPDVLSGRTARRRLRLAGILFVIVMLVILAYGLVSRAAQNARSLAANSSRPAAETFGVRWALVPCSAGLVMHEPWISQGQAGQPGPPPIRVDGRCRARLAVLALVHELR